MKSLSDSDTTVVFVSHNMAAVQALCRRCLLLEAGRSVAIGPTAEIVARYVHSHAPAQHFRRKQPAQNQPCLMQADISSAPSGTAIYARLKIRSPERTRLAVQLRIKDPLGSPVAFAGLGQFNSEAMSEIAVGETTLELAVPVDRLAHGEYALDIALAIPMVSLVDLAEDCLRFSVNRPPADGAVSALQQSW
jgi:lipopolysaccharide transport system ATP-binding protein